MGKCLSSIYTDCTIDSEFNKDTYKQNSIYDRQYYIKGGIPPEYKKILKQDKDLKIIAIEKECIAIC